jgi:hypothetical protein
MELLFQTQEELREKIYEKKRLTRQTGVKGIKLGKFKGLLKKVLLFFLCFHLVNSIHYKEKQDGKFSWVH